MIGVSVCHGMFRRIAIFCKKNQKMKTIEVVAIKKKGV